MQWPLLRCNGVFIMYYTLVDFHVSIGGLVQT